MLKKPLSHAAIYLSFASCHHLRAKPGEHEHFLPLLCTLPPRQVQSHANRAKWIISFPFSYCQPWQQLSGAISAAPLKATIALLLSLSHPLVLFAIVIWIPGLLLTADSRVVSLILISYRQISCDALGSFTFSMQIHCLYNVLWDKLHVIITDHVK